MWSQLKKQLPLLEGINFNCLIVAPIPVEIEMHVFCDASENANGACIHLHSTDAQSKHNISLVRLKSRFAQVNPSTSPHFDLCTALLLARLYSVPKKALEIGIKWVYSWSDFTIALY